MAILNNLKMKKILIILFSFILNFLCAEIKLPYIFSDNMVLQRNSEIIIWGSGSNGEKVSVQFKKQHKNTVTDKNGNWKISLKPETEGGPFEMIISGDNRIVLHNILIGDVFLASGQSNMEWNLASSDGYQEELKSTSFPQVRHVKITKSINSLPQKDILKTQWNIADTSTLGDFSAVAYFFAKKMYKEKGVPIGIINSSWGGTVIEAWIPRDSFEKSEYFKNMISKIPEVNIEDLQKQNIEKKTKFIEGILNSKVSDFDKTRFLSILSDDSFLAEIDVPKPWENQGYIALDGIVWLRKTVELTAEDCNQDAKIYLGQIDDEDVTYFNGQIIGQMKQWSDERVYTIPKQFLKEGKNIIAIKITDTGGGGGLWSQPDVLKLITSKQIIPLAGKWKIGIEEIFDSINQNEFPSIIYNSMIHPFIQTKISGIIWYQGESNIDRAYEYNKSFPLLIKSWRGFFGKDLPFYFVQLSSLESPGKNSNEGSPWAELRDAQTKTLKLFNTGMVVTTDIGNPEDIHPKNKKTVGERLADLALKNGRVSPVYKKSEITGGKVIVEFSPSVKLISKDGKALRGFEIADKDQNFHSATAEIVENKIVVFNNEIVEPTAVRYGWKGDDSEINLFTDYRFPVSPFRTDNFELTTKDVKYSESVKY